MFRNLNKKSRRGFTLIELLVVVLILAILMAVALPLYLAAVADAEKKTCRANMQTIATAVQAARVRDRAQDYAPYYANPISLGTLQDLQTRPICPNLGVYSTEQGAAGTNASYRVRCTTTPNRGHGTFEPGLDAN